MSSGFVDVDSTTTGNAPQGMLAFDFSQDLASVLARQIEVEQNQRRPWTFGIGSLLFQERHGLFAIAGYVQRAGDAAFFKSFREQPHIAGVVHHQENFGGQPWNLSRIRHGNARRQDFKTKSELSDP